MLIVHATHEAGLKLGGIGAVLDGLLSAPAYTASVDRTIVAGPINTWNHAEMERLTAPANRLRIIYSSIHGVNEASEEVSSGLRSIEQRMNVRFLYGTRVFAGVEHEVLLVDAGGITGETINPYKFYLWQRWGLPSSQHESTWEYSFFLNAGEPLYAAIETITAGMSPETQRFVIAHEWLGLPLAFSALLRDPDRYKTVFYAHEVATARQLVESHEGHDTRFYNALRLGLEQGYTMDQVFGDQSWFYKHSMLQRAGVCHGLFAVGDLVKDELRFLGGVFRDRPIDLVYNGIPSDPVSFEEKLHSRDLLLDYAENLLGYRPDYVFTHVSRMVTSKALWRDLRVLEHLEWTLAAQGKRAVHFVVSTAAPAGRSPSDIYRWEAEYGWPVAHRADNGDLRDAEVHFYFHQIEPFQWGRQAVQVILANQFGWDREHCGWRMPETMRFADLRIGTDAEFGQSIYEPFGIAQLEPLRSGARCILSSVCGSLGFVNRASGEWGAPTVAVGDYVYIPPEWSLWSPWDALRIDRSVREGLEYRNSLQVAQALASALPTNDAERAAALAEGSRVAAGMSWDVVAREYLLPALERL
jgi:hypothetical protein